jgi:hypothetical protein
VIAPALVVAAIALPWLILLPLPGVVAAAAHAITLIAAFHGAGLIVARLGNRRGTAPLLLVQWGIAMTIGLSGLAIACHAGTLACQAVLVFGCAAVHTASVGAQFARCVARVEARLAGPPWWLPPTALLVGIGALTVLGAAGGSFAQPFDDDGHLLAQLRRVLDTGALADPIGYPRSGGLGGQVALLAAVAGAGDGFARAVDPLAQVLALGLAASRIGARDRSTALWSMIVIAGGFALAPPIDPLPCWLAVGLVVALHAMLSEPEVPALPLAITAGALIALRYELAPVAAVAMIAAWWRRRDAHHVTAVLIGGAGLVAAPLLIARASAWHSVPWFAQAALAAPSPSSWLVRIAIAAAIAIPTAFAILLALPDRRELRWVAAATAVALGALAADVTGTGAYSARLAWPLAIGFAVTAITQLAGSGRSSPAALIGSLVLCVLIYEGSGARDRATWGQRLAAAATDIGALQRPPGDPVDPYAAVLAQLPGDAAVAVWVAAPEQLDYARRRIIDLRTPAFARLREHRWAAHVSKLDSIVSELAPFLLIEGDDAPVKRVQTDLLYRFVCQPPRPICADDLEAIALRHPIVARRDNLVLVDLRR